MEALGGEWGRLQSEEKFDLFEKALFLTVQKGDESNDSYLARHDAAFEELISQKVQLEDVRAYILLRQSVLSAEDRKKIILDCSGNLTYDVARKSIRLLGAKFFQELQTQGKPTAKTKTYDVNYVEEEAVYFQEDEEMDEDILVQQLIESGDEDALFVQESEEQILAACQENPNLPACFTSQQEARQRVRDKAKGRGFWPVAGQKGRENGKKGMPKCRAHWRHGLSRFWGSAQKPGRADCKLYMPTLRPTWPLEEGMSSSDWISYRRNGKEDQ